MKTKISKSKKRAAVRRAGRQREPAIDEGILKASLQLFLEQGPQGVNFEQISSRTGISRATIYRRWKTRHELLSATLNSARISVVKDPAALANLSSKDFLGYLEDTIVSGLMSPMVPKMVTQLIGAFTTHPELLTTYARTILEPGWKAIFDAVERMQLPVEPDLVRDILAGAIIFRLVSRTGPPQKETERAWTKRLIRQTGLSAKSHKAV